MLSECISWIWQHAARYNFKQVLEELQQNWIDGTPDVEGKALLLTKLYINDILEDYHPAVLYSKSKLTRLYTALEALQESFPIQNFSQDQDALHQYLRLLRILKFSIVTLIFIDSDDNDHKLKNLDAYFPEITNTYWNWLETHLHISGIEHTAYLIKTHSVARKYFTKHINIPKDPEARTKTMNSIAPELKKELENLLRRIEHYLNNIDDEAAPGFGCTILEDLSRKGEWNLDLQNSADETLLTLLQHVIISTKEEQLLKCLQELKVSFTFTMSSIHIEFLVSPPPPPGHLDKPPKS